MRRTRNSLQYEIDGADSSIGARAASFGDPVAVSMLQAAGRRVGSMLASVVNFFSPSLIVIGDGVANSPDLFLAAIRETIYRRSLPLATRRSRSPGPADVCVGRGSAWAGV